MNQNKTSYSFINDVQNDDKIKIMAKQILDSVIINLSDYACTVTLISPACPPTSNYDICGHTTSQLCKINDLKITPGDKYFTANGDAVVNGICNFSNQNGDPYSCECNVTLPFSCLLCNPSRSVIKPELNVIASFNFTCTTMLSENTFCALANGAVITALCSYTPITVPGGRYYPQQAGSRAASSPCVELDLFPIVK